MSDDVETICNICLENIEIVDPDIPNNAIQYISPIPDIENDTLEQNYIESQEITNLAQLDYIYPCKCKNPVHIKCLLTWLNHKTTTNCEICNSQYNINQNIFNLSTYNNINNNYNINNNNNNNNNNIDIEYNQPDNIDRLFNVQLNRIRSRNLIRARIRADSENYDDETTNLCKLMKCIIPCSMFITGLFLYIYLYKDKP